MTLKKINCSAVRYVHFYGDYWWLSDKDISASLKQERLGTSFYIRCLQVWWHFKLGNCTDIEFSCVGWATEIDFF